MSAIIYELYYILVVSNFGNDSGLTYSYHTRIAIRSGGPAMSWFGSILHCTPRSPSCNTRSVYLISRIGIASYRATVWIRRSWIPSFLLSIFSSILLSSLFRKKPYGNSRCPMNEDLQYQLFFRLVSCKIAFASVLIESPDHSINASGCNFRSIAFAGARVSVSIRTLTEPDFLWLGSQSVLFGLAEMTFAFWVFCIPAIPKSIHASQIRALPRYLWSKMRSTTTLAKKPSKDSESSWPISYDTPPPENGRKVVSENSGQISNKQSPQKKQSKSSILQQSRTKPSAANRILRTTDILASVDSTHENVNESGILTKSAPIGNDWVAVGCVKSEAQGSRIVKVAKMLLKAWVVEESFFVPYRARGTKRYAGTDSCVLDGLPTFLTK